MQIDDEHDEAICTSPMILEYVDDKVYAPSNGAHETLETVGQVEDGVGKFIKIPFFNWYNHNLIFPIGRFRDSFLAHLSTTCSW